MLSIKIPTLHQKYPFEFRSCTGSQKILMNSPLSFLISSPGGKVFTANQASASMFGYDTPVEFVESISDIAAQLYEDPSDREEFKCLLERYGLVKAFDCRMKRKNGSKFWCSINSMLVKDENSQEIYFQSFILDISRHKEDLMESRRRYEYMLKSSMHMNSFQNIIGRSKKMQEIFMLMQQTAGTDTSVLITGETGTGKELIAKALHSLSPRSKSPLIKMSCLTLPEQLLDSELFGHVRGAVAGAYHNKIGHVEAAEGGTLFLDELSHLSPRMQFKLFRFLVNKEYELIGDPRKRKADVRIIAAASGDLAGMVEKGEFRKDLYYLLKKINIHVPSLRERREDIPLLSKHFCRRFADKYQKQNKEISSEAMRILMEFSWPGNVRELEHAIEHSVLLCQGQIIGIEHFPGELFGKSVNDQS